MECRSQPFQRGRRVRLPRFPTLRQVAVSNAFPVVGVNARFAILVFSSSCVFGSQCFHSVSPVRRPERNTSDAKSPCQVSAGMACQTEFGVDQTLMQTAIACFIHQPPPPNDRYLSNHLVAVVCASGVLAIAVTARGILASPWRPWHYLAVKSSLEYRRNAEALVANTCIMAIDWRT